MQSKSKARKETLTRVQGELACQKGSKSALSRGWVHGDFRNAPVSVYLKFINNSIKKSFRIKS